MRISSTDAFISYNYVDKEKVIKIVENLKKEQIVLCMDGGEQCFARRDGTAHQKQ